MTAPAGAVAAAAGTAFWAGTSDEMRLSMDEIAWLRFDSLSPVPFALSVAGAACEMPKP